MIPGTEEFLHEQASRLDKAEHELGETRRAASRAEYAIKKARESLELYAATYHEEIPEGNEPPDPDEEEDVPEDIEPNPDPSDPADPLPDPNDPIPSVDGYTTFGEYGPEPQPLVKGTFYIAGVDGITTSARYNRNESGLVLREPFTLKANLSDSAGIRAHLMDLFKPRVRYLINDTYTDWYDYPEPGHVITPEELGPGVHAITVEMESEADGVIFLSEVISVAVPGKTGPQTIPTGPHKYDLSRQLHLMNSGRSRGTGKLIVHWNGGPPSPTPLKHRPATPFSERTMLNDLYCQMVSPRSNGAPRRPYMIKDKEGVIPEGPQIYYTGSLHGRRNAKVAGERGQATTLPVIVDGHVSAAGNLYFIATCGTLGKIHTTGRQEILAGFYNDYGTFVEKGMATSWPSPYDSFHGSFVNNDKKGWWEPWGLAFKTPTLNVYSDPNAPHNKGASHHEDIQAMITDTLHGDLDVVVWDKGFCEPVAPPKIYTVAKGIGETWGCVYDTKRDRWWYTTRSDLNGRFEGGHEIGWIEGKDVDAAIRGEIDPDSIQRHVFYRNENPPKAKTLSTATSYRWTTDWASTRTGINQQIEVQRARGFKPGHRSQAVFSYPEQIKMLSDGRLVVSSHYLAMIAVIDPEAETIEMGIDASLAITNQSKWISFSVDDGKSGPKDQIWMATWAAFKGSPHVASLGEEPIPTLSGSMNRVLPKGKGNYAEHINYPVSVIVGHGNIYHAGMTIGVQRFTKRLETDVEINLNRFQAGKLLYERGTTRDLNPDRPSLIDKYGTHGVDQWGAEPFVWTVPPELAGNEELTYYHWACRVGTIFEDLEYEWDGNTIKPKAQGNN